MCHLMDEFSTKYNKRFLWKFSANSHDKGVFDGIGIMSNQLFRVHGQKRKVKIIVQDAKSFYQVASKAMNATEVFLIDKTQVEAYRDTDPFDSCQTVPGIMSMYIISTGDDDVKLWKNVSFSTRMSQTSLSISNISIQQKRKRCSIIQLRVTL